MPIGPGGNLPVFLDTRPRAHCDLHMLQAVIDTPAGEGACQRTYRTGHHLTHVANRQHIIRTRQHGIKFVEIFGQGGNRPSLQPI